MKIQNISSTPKYISDFINHNFTKLIEIYDNGISENKIGVLYFKCSEKENKMEVYFLNEEQILLNLQTDKKIFLVNDNDINSMFILYI